MAQVQGNFGKREAEALRACYHLGLRFVAREGRIGFVWGKGGGWGGTKSMPVPHAGGRDMEGATVPATAMPSSGSTSRWEMVAGGTKDTLGYVICRQGGGGSFV